MTSNRSKKTSIAAKNAEIEWVVAHERETTAEPSVERGHVDEPDIDVYQPGPDEPVWLPTEPQDASDAEDEPRVAKKVPRAAGAKPGRAGGKARNGAAEDVPNNAVSANGEPAPIAPAQKPKRTSKRSAAQSDDPAGTTTQDDAGERTGTLANERAVDVAPAATETSAAAPVTAKRKLQKFVAERAEQQARERAAEPVDTAQPRVADSHQAPDVTAPSRGEDPIDHQWDAIPDAPASTLPPMEDYLCELGTLSVAQLVARHVEVVGKKPKIKSRPWLVKKLGWIEQTRRFGGLSVAAKRKLESLMSEIELPMPTPRAATSDAKPPKSADDMPIGVRLERKWHGRLIVATRVPEGWSCEGQVFRTLSAAAKSVSGSHVSGPAFFGIWKPKSEGAR
jgi:hypothetical protein